MLITKYQLRFMSFKQIVILLSLDGSPFIIQFDDLISLIMDTLWSYSSSLTSYLMLIFESLNTCMFGAKVINDFSSQTDERANCTPEYFHLFSDERLYLISYINLYIYFRLS